MNAAFRVQIAAFMWQQAMFKLACAIKPFGFSRAFKRIRLMVFVTLVLVQVSSASAKVIINEFMAATSERRLTFDPQGVPRIGSGIPWTATAFDAVGWSNGLLPAGYGFSGLATDLGTQMRSKTPSAYFRKEFVVSAAEAAVTNILSLLIQYNDGYVAWLNGQEVARANCGATNQFMFASQPAFNVSTSSVLLAISLGAASNRLHAGTNVLAIQGHNAEFPSTTGDTSRSTTHTPTLEFRLNAGLRLNAGGDLASAVELVPAGPSAGAWRYFVGIAEPSGGVFDPSLITRTFKPPEREEDDFDQPAAFVDWVELHNDGVAPVNVGGWSLTDDKSEVAKWRFPTNTVVTAGGFLLVLCDGRDEANKPVGSAAMLHTNFKLADEGGYLQLHDSSGALVDQIKDGYPAQDPFHAFARDPALAERFAFSATATPGVANVGPFLGLRPGEPLFQDAAAQALPGGVYRTPGLVLYLRHENPLARIRFTLDATEPTARNGIAYTNPISLQQTLEKTGIVVRARAFLSDAIASDVVTHTYILRQPAGLTNAPVLSFSGDPTHSFYAPWGIISVVGGRYADTGSGSIWVAGGEKSYHMPTGDGIPFERAIHVEFFPVGSAPTNPPALRTDCGLRMSASAYTRPRLNLYGAATTSPWTPYDSNQKPSFNLCFAGDYGVSTLDYDLFPGYDVRKFDSLRVRAGKNDNYNPFVTDELVRRLWQDLGHVGARGLFCSLYVNGIYRGVYNLCERIREPFFRAHYRSDFQWDVNYIYNWVDGDSTTYQQLLAILDRDQTVLVNWPAVTNRLDVVNAADYFLLNIYAATWDWPENNFAFARERSASADNRFRFLVWDAEGAFNALSAGKGVSYNTITQDLVLAAGDSDYNRDLPRIFRRLVSSPEFRLLFADRVNRHLFNGGVLDDRDPDGVGPSKSRLRQRLDELIAEAGPLVKYSSGQTLKTSAFDVWTTPGTGRRGYLLGLAAGRRMLRDNKLWPSTEPPVFNTFGGAVPPGFNLTMTSAVATAGQTAKIYFTTNNVDPRLPGGARHSDAQWYAGPFPLSGLVTVKARAQNDTTSEWSPLTEATFAPAATPASAANFVIAELMYHPPPPTLAEAAAGYVDGEDFEFVRLLNIGKTPLDLNGVKFSLGITFDFTGKSVRYLAVGASVLVVKNLSAFQQRYGRTFDHLVAGEFIGNLSNGGERVQLLASGGAVIRDFTFSDSSPWPTRADGDGPSLVLCDPASNPDPAMAESWMPSAIPGGLPSGAPRAQTYAQWRALFWSQPNSTNDLVSGPVADADGDGLSNFWEYALGQDPSRKSLAPRISVSLDASGQLVIELCSVPHALDATLVWEWSTDLASWFTEPACLTLTQTLPQRDGTSLVTFTETETSHGSSGRFVRLRIAGMGL
jgi:hypothetical protein